MASDNHAPEVSIPTPCADTGGGWIIRQMPLADLLRGNIDAASKE